MNTDKKTISLTLITIVASLGGLLFGFDMAVISGVLPLVQEQFSLSPVQEGTFVSAALLGCIIGVAFSGELTDRLGRRKPLMLAATLFFLSSVGCAVMPGLLLITVSRLIAGIGIGIASNVVPLYISEIAPAGIRGRLVTYYQLALTFGILIAYLSNAALLNFAAPGLSGWPDGFLRYIFVSEVWRGMFGVGVIPSVLFLAGLCVVPESPRWLIRKGRYDEAVSVMERISSKSDERIVRADAERMAGPAKGSYRDLLAPGVRKALIIGVLLPLFSQFSGINAIIYYGPTILNNAGISLSSSLISQVIFGLANMLFTLVAIWKVDSWGRRPLYLFGTSGAAVSLVATAFCFYTGATTSIWLLISVLAFLACFAFSIGPLKFVVASEIFPNAIRGRALAISIMVMWIADTIVGQLTPVLLKGIGSAGTFLFFAFFCVVAFVTVFRLLPETKGRSLEQIEESWTDDDPVHVMH